MMLSASQELWLQAIKQRRAQRHIALIESASGVYVYGKHLPKYSELFDTLGVPVLDGSLLLDGSWGVGGSLRIIDRGARVLDFEDIEYTLNPDSDSLIASLAMSEMSQYSLSLNNADRHLSNILAVESWLAAILTIRFGFAGLNYNGFLTVFSGLVEKVTLKSTRCDISALNNF